MEKNDGPNESVLTVDWASGVLAGAPQDAALSHTELRAQRAAKRAADREARIET